MERAARLAGFFTAHAVWSVSDGGPFVPMLGTETGEGDRSLRRFAGASLEEAATAARNGLTSSDAPRAVAIVDGYLTLPRGRTDALFVTVREQREDGARTLDLAVPYRPASDPRGFAVHPPKLLSYDGDPAELEGFTTAFFEGVEGHEQGARVWNERFADDGARPYHTPDTLPPTGVHAAEASAASTSTPSDAPRRALTAVAGVGLAAAMLFTSPPGNGLLHAIWGLPGAIVALVVASAAFLPLIRR